MTSKTVELPRGALMARFRVELKKTYGSFRLDDVSAAALTTGPVGRRIERVLLATDAAGNLFLPGDQVVYRVTVEAVKPLPASTAPIPRCRAKQQVPRSRFRPSPYCSSTATRTRGLPGNWAQPTCG